MKYALLFAVLLVVSVGRAGVNELSLTVCQDALFRSGVADSIVRPVAVLGGFGFRLGTSGTLDLKAGYSGYANQVRPLAPTDQRRTLQGVRLQAAPVFRVSTPIKEASAFGGAGLALRVSYLRQGFRSASVIYDNWRYVRTLGVDQTYLVGLSYEPSRKFGVDLTLERVGFSLAYDVERAYHRHEGQGNDTLSLIDGQNTLDVGWRAAAPIGVGVGLRLKL